MHGIRDPALGLEGTGEDEIDRQHGEVMRRFDELFSVSHSAASRPIKRKCVQDLLDAVIYHFCFEEGLMVDLGFPYHGQHSQQHNAMVEQLIMLIDEFDRGFVEIGPRTVSSLRDGFKVHIDIYDREFIQFQARADQLVGAGGRPTGTGAGWGACASWDSV